MRGLRSLGGLVVVLIALGAYLYFVESKRPAGGDADKKEKAFTVGADKVEELTIKSESGDRTTVRKTGPDWQIVQPAAGKPDSAEVSGITSNLASLEVQRVIDENPADLAEYSLAQPRVELTFKADGKEHKLLIGRKTPPGSDLYARIDDQKRVVLIPSFVDTTFNRTTFDLRDKAVLTVNRDEIGSLGVTTPSSAMRFDKTAGEWKMVQPVPARADFSAVEGLVSRLATLQMKSIAAAQATDLVPYGLDKPAATVTIGSGSSQATLAIGKPSGEGAVYARDLSKPVVVTIESALLDELKKAPADYRQKDLFDARAFNATRVEVAHNGVTTAFEKVKSKNKDGQEQDTWKQVAPSAKDVDQAKVDDLIGAITQARASSFVDAPPKGALDKPELTITIKSNEGKREEKVTIGRAGADVFASRAGEPGAAKLDVPALDAMVKALGEIK
jgi:Domain of unknown function (DUF4340)